MDLLTHLFLPIAVIYVLRPDLFPSPWYFLLAGFAVLPDFDKLLGMPGTLHSLFLLAPIAGVCLLLERRVRDDHVYATLVTLLLVSHLVLDVIDGGPVPFLFPLVETGIGLTYPTTIVFGEGVFDISIQEPLPDVQTDVPDSSRQGYPLVNGYGILSGLVLVVFYVANEYGGTDA